MTYLKVPFPSIDSSKPLGSYRVSTVDDHERETRRWLKQALLALSGYPETDTVGIIGWTDGTRPRRSPNGNYLVGYNTGTLTIELVAEDGTIANISKAIALAAHPVGTIYETTDASFDPNSAWGGTWLLMNDGKFLLSTSTQYALGSVGGEEEHILITEEIPSHDHKHTHQHTHTAGELTFDVNGSFSEVSNGSLTGIKGTHYDNNSIGFTPEIEISGSASYDDTISSDAYTGGGLAHNNMPPYLVVNRWHRIA